METDVVYFFGFFITLIVLIGLSIYSGKKAGKKSGSFTGGGDSSAAIVAGAIIGTLVGGSSTVGTAQLAYNYGLSAWWFTLGGGIGCLIMAIWFVKPLRKKCDGTLTGLIAAEYGPKVGFAATILSSVGIYINIIAQLIAATAVIAIVIPGVNSFAAALIAALLMTLYVIFGGVKGTGIVGILKTVLLYVAAIGGGCIALKLFGDLQSVLDNPNFQHAQYLNLFARGIGKDLGAGVSLVLGVLSTQTYAQACLSGRSDSTDQCVHDPADRRWRHPHRYVHERELPGSGFRKDGLSAVRHGVYAFMAGRHCHCHLADRGGRNRGRACVRHQYDHQSRCCKWNSKKELG